MRHEHVQCKPPLYFLDGRYWGFSAAAIVDAVEEIKDQAGVVINKSSDEDVLKEEEACQQRMNQVGEDNVEWPIDVRGLQQRFSRVEKGPKDWISKEKSFWAVKAPWFGIGRGQLFALLGPNGAGDPYTLNPKPYVVYLNTGCSGPTAPVDS